MTARAPGATLQIVGGQAIEVMSAAAPQAVELLVSDFAAERRPEERLRQSFLAALDEDPRVEQTMPPLGATSEFHPELAEWPDLGPGSRLGGFDLAVRLAGRDGWNILGEFKWDSLWMEFWDGASLRVRRRCRLPGGAHGVISGLLWGRGRPL